MERVKVSVGEGYSHWAREYDDYPNPLIMVEEPLVRALLMCEGRLSGRRVLDVACGTGRHTLWLAAHDAKVTGVDPNAEMLAVAREKEEKTAKESGESSSDPTSHPSSPRPRIAWLEGEATKLPVPDASFDIVLNALLMEHVPEVAPILRDAHRVLAPGGALVLSVYHPWFPIKGVPAHFASGRDKVEYELPTYVHLPSAYINVLIELGMRLTHFYEPVVDDALIARRPNMEKHRGLPLAIVLRAVKS